MNDATLIRAYLAHAETRARDGTDAEHFEAAEEIRELVIDDPERAWPIVCEVIRRTTADDILAFVVAGPLEDLLVHHGPAFIDRVEALAAEDAHFKRAVSGVWGWNSMAADVRKRLDDLLRDAPRL